MSRKRDAWDVLTARLRTPHIAVLAVAVFVAGASVGVILGVLFPGEPAEDTGARPIAAAPAPAAPAARTSPVSPPPAAAPRETPQVARRAPIPDLAEPTQPPPWVSNAVAVPDTGGRPKIAIVVDDLGVDRRRSTRVIDLPGPLTLAFLPYARDLQSQTAAARVAGHELLVHLPMQPEGYEDPGPGAFTLDMEPDEIVQRLRLDLDRFDGYVGVSNHMGSAFTRDAARMRAVLQEVRARGLMFLDSRTTGETVGDRLAREMNMPYASRDVFLDNTISVEAVKAQLAELEWVAERRGFAVGIGHPYDATLAALAEWLPSLSARGFALVPVSAVARLNGAPGPAGPLTSQRREGPPYGRN